MKPPEQFHLPGLSAYAQDDHIIINVQCRRQHQADMLLTCRDARGLARVLHALHTHADLSPRQHRDLRCWISSQLTGILRRQRLRAVLLAAGLHPN